MANPLVSLFNQNSYGVANSTPGILGTKTRTQTLPYGGGTFNPAGDSKITPTPIFNTPAPRPIAPVVPTVPAAPAQTSSFYDKYRDPKTGEIMTPEEYAIYLGNKIPKGNGEITNYAGDAVANPNQTAEELTARATGLNNSRNDIATGTTDPYGVASKSGIAYSPAELQAIEKAYAGIYDPALQDVFARLKTTQANEEQKANLQAAKELEIFKTNESIRQWRATTGTKAGGSGEENKLFTRTQLNNGASNSGLSIGVFDSLDDDIKNFYINPPMALNDENKKVPIYQNFEEDFAKVTSGEMSADDLSASIAESPLPESVKHYFIEQIPAEPAKKESWFKKVWGAIKGK